MKAREKKEEVLVEKGERKLQKKKVPKKKVVKKKVQKKVIKRKDVQQKAGRQNITGKKTHKREETEKKVSKQLIYNILIAEFAIVICVSAFVLIRYAVQSVGSENEFAELKELISADFDTGTLGGTGDISIESPVNEQGILREYEQLYNLNSDLAGWISIEDTGIDYPVMQSEEDGDFYIDHNFRKKESASGVIFIDERTKPESGNMLILYGHNMRSGTMFADLLEFADEEFYEKHPIIQFDTIYEKGTYEVVAAFYTEAYPDDDMTHFNFYHYTDLGNEMVFNQYKRNIEDLALFPCGDFEMTDELITLVTCSYHSGDGRFVVVAKKV